MAAVRSNCGSVLRGASVCLQDCSSIKLFSVPWIPFEWRKFPPVLAIWIVCVSVVFITFRVTSVLLLSSESPPFVPPRSLLRAQIAGSTNAPQVQLNYPPNRSAQLAVSSTEKYKTYGNRCANATNNSTADGFKYYLAAVIANRIFHDDLFRMSSYDIKQWIEYMFYAGIEHIYWYDTAHNDSESQETHLAMYVHSGLLTYHRFHHLFPDSLVRGYHFEQDNTYRHFLDRHGTEAKWVAELDADEYPFSVRNTGSCFLRRAMEEYDREKAILISQVLMECMFFVGNAIQDSEEGWLIERYQRRKQVTEGMGKRPKPIFRSNLVVGRQYESPHAMPMRAGFTVVAEPERLRLNHYWGPRATEFRPDTAELLEMVLPDPSIQPIVNELKAITGLTTRNATLF